MANVTLILASGSKNRQELLDLIGIKYKVVSSRFNEGAIDIKDPYKKVMALAQAKAEEVAKTHHNALVLAADTVGLYRSRILEKPKFKTNALERLIQLSGRAHYILSGWYMVNTQTQKTYQGVSATKVMFRKIGKKELEDYVNDHDVKNWAAGYSPFNTKALAFIDKIEGSVTGFSHGLPMEQVIPALIKENYL